MRRRFLQSPGPHTGSRLGRGPGRGVAGALTVLLVWVLASAAGARATEDRTGLAVEGVDRSRLLPPAGAEVSPYRNTGYRLRLIDGEASVEVEATPLGSTSRFDAPDLGDSTEPIARLAATVATGARTHYEAVSRILTWVARHIEYRLDRQEPQDALSVLDRRSAYCTGIARTSVALLSALGIEAREVAGYVVADGLDGPQGYHRWIEVRLPDVGWVFSDPLYSHHYVPANYLRLASERLRVSDGVEALLLERR
ncbi:MAG: transglutaminase-like domain-containing protein, partial [Holophagales bacterium]|nr:transglutaminase-like domain-containing protein [Holophagales bacterium]